MIFQMEAEGERAKRLCIAQPAPAVTELGEVCHLVEDGGHGQLPAWQFGARTPWASGTASTNGVLGSSFHSGHGALSREHPTTTTNNVNPQTQNVLS